MDQETWVDVRLRTIGKTRQYLAEKLNVSESHVSDILRGRASEKGAADKIARIRAILADVDPAEPLDGETKVRTKKAGKKKGDA